MKKARLLWEFIKLTRPLFLGGGLMLYGLGALIAVHEGMVIDPVRLVTGQLLVTSIQLLTHYTNEFYDQEADRLNPNRTWFSGGSGVLVSGALSAQVARRAMTVLTLFALLMLTLAGLQTPVVFLYGLVALVAAWSYSGPPLVLVSRGLGELAASLVVALLVPVVGYAMQSGGPVSPAIWITCLPLILLHFAMLIAFQIPDLEADEAAGKRTIAVRLGADRAAWLHNLSLLAAFCVILWLTLAQWPGARWSWLGLPLAVWQAIYVRRLTDRPASRPQRRFLWLTMGAIGLFALTSALWLLGLLIV